MPVFGGAKGAQASPGVQVKPKPKDPVGAILLSNRLADYLKKSNRYTPPPKLLKSIENLSDTEKEKRLLKWFVSKDRSFLRSMAFWRILGRGLLVLTIITLVIIFAGPYILTGLGYLWTNKGTIWNGIKNFFGFGPAPAVGAAGVASKIMKVLSVLSFVWGLFSLEYITMPLQYFLGIIHNIYLLVGFYYNPKFDNKLQGAENVYLISYYLFSPAQRRLMEDLLLSTRAGDMSKVNEVEVFIKMHRAIPYGVKSIVYDQDKIDYYFDGYSPEMKAFAEELIVLLVVYTEAIESGKEYLIKNLSIKGVLLYGPPGTGKSHFFKMICKATGLNHIVLNIMDPEVDLRGKTGDKMGFGTASALGKGFLSGADPETGRSYKNSPVIIEEIDKSAALKGGVEAYYHMILDPKGESMKDDYLHYELPKPIFMWATTNYRDTLAEALRDRFSLFYVGAIPKDLKKKIARNILIPLWVALLSDPDLKAKYNHYLPAEECEYILTRRLEKFIDQSDEAGMRGCEDEAKIVALELLVASFKEESDIIRYMEELEAWKEEQAALGIEEEWEEEDLLEELDPEDREWSDIRWETGNWNDALAQTQWFPPEYDEGYEEEEYEEEEYEEQPEEYLEESQIESETQDEWEEYPPEEEYADEQPWEEERQPAYAEERQIATQPQDERREYAEGVEYTEEQMWTEQPEDVYAETAPQPQTQDQWDEYAEGTEYVEEPQRVEEQPQYVYPEQTATQNEPYDYPSETQYEDEQRNEYPEETAYDEEWNEYEDAEYNDEYYYEQPEYEDEEASNEGYAPTQDQYPEEWG